METRKYPSDLTDEQWALIEPLIPVYPGGRPRKTPLRQVVNAVFYLVRTGCQWRFLPKDFPPKSTVWRYFDEWRSRRLSVDREKTILSCEAMIRLAMIHLMLTRLCPAPDSQEFQYRMAA